MKQVLQAHSVQFKLWISEKNQHNCAEVLVSILDKRALETTNDEEVARKIQAEWDAEEERKRFEELKKTKPKTTLRKPTSLAQERNQMMNFLKGQGYKNLQNLSSTDEGIIDRIYNHLYRVVDDYMSKFLQNRLRFELIGDLNIIFGRRLESRDDDFWKRSEEGKSKDGGSLTLRSAHNRGRRWHYDSHAS
ncbi:hypothetical protein Tco_0039450 [Tanacetum coccineum]